MTFETGTFETGTFETGTFDTETFDSGPIGPEQLGQLIRARRTTKLFDADEPVDPEIIVELCELATWAPNHRKTEPWRFAVFTGVGRSHLGNTIANVMESTGAHDVAVAKTRTKYLRASTVIVVGSVPGSDEKVTAENRDATAAAVHTLLLGATAHGLATLWSSVATPNAPEVLTLCGFPPSTYCAGAIYLGHPTGCELGGKRAEPQINWIG